MGKTNSMLTGHHPCLMGLAPSEINVIGANKYKQARIVSGILEWVSMQRDILQHSDTLCCGEALLCEAASTRNKVTSHFDCSRCGSMNRHFCWDWNIGKMNPHDFDLPLKVPPTDNAFRFIQLNVPSCQGMNLNDFGIRLTFSSVLPWDGLSFWPLLDGFL